MQLQQLADVADGLSLPVWELGNVEVTLKSDGSPVTAIDRAIESELRLLLAKDFPDDGFCGEEVGESHGSPTTTGPLRTWVVDGIDGTRAFVNASPAWSTQIALTKDGVLVAGIVTCPALGQRWYTTQDGAYVLPKGKPPARVSIHDALVSVLQAANLSSQG